MLGAALRTRSEDHWTQDHGERSARANSWRHCAGLFRGSGWHCAGILAADCDAVSSPLSTALQPEYERQHRCTLGTSARHPLAAIHHSSEKSEADWSDFVCAEPSLSFGVRCGTGT